jgi:hypothetical protein
LALSLSGRQKPSFFREFCHAPLDISGNSLGKHLTRND